MQLFDSNTVGALTLIVWGEAIVHKQDPKPMALPARSMKDPSCDRHSDIQMNAIPVALHPVGQSSLASPQSQVCAVQTEQHRNQHVSTEGKSVRPITT